MIARREGGWIVYYRDDGVTELIRVKPPKDGFTMAEWEKFIAHLKKELQAKELGAN
jgi:hypothetical protein